MKVTILTLGSRGDVQPYVALGAGLRQGGHAVTLATGPSFEGFVVEQGLAFRPLSADYLTMLQSPEAQASLRGRPAAALKLLREILPTLRRILDEAWAASQGADVVVYHPKALAGYHVAEKLGVPGVLTAVQPAFTPTTVFANPLLPLRSLGGPLNRLSYDLVLRLISAPYQGLINRWRRETLGLPPRGRFASELRRNGQPVPTLYGCSPHVVPPPPDWPPSTQMSGYWFLNEPASWQPPADLLEFLAQDPPPVYVGFGSMATGEAQRLTGIVIAALRRAGQRGLIATGAGGLAATDLPSSVFGLTEAPHSWLFPRVAAVVHHGGAGTTAAGLRAGRPSVVCPVFGDQPFWGRRVAELGAGPRPIPQRRLREDALAEAIRQATGNPIMRRRAEDLGAAIRADSGVARAVRFLEVTR